MVHCLTTLHRLNVQAVREARGKPRKPARTADSIDKYKQNTRWPAAVLKKTGTLDLYKAYEKSDNEETRRRKELAENDKGESRCIVHGIICG